MPHDLESVLPVTSYSADAKDAKQVAEICAEHETVARFATFSADSAWALGNTIRKKFVEQNEDGKAGVVIHIETFSGHVLFSCAVGNPAAIGPDNWNWVRAKMNVVKRYGVSSLRKGRELAAKGQTPEEKGLNFPEYACHGGGFPIWLANNTTGPIGAIVVSGLPQLSDHQLIIDSLVKDQHLLAGSENDDFTSQNERH